MDVARPGWHRRWSGRARSSSSRTISRPREPLVRRVVEAPLRLPSAADCLRFERESFGALHQMLSGLSEPEREAAWTEIGEALAAFEGPDGFSGPCELIVAAAVK